MISSTGPRLNGIGRWNVTAPTCSRSNCARSSSTARTFAVLTHQAHSVNLDLGSALLKDLAAVARFFTHGGYREFVRKTVLVVMAARPTRGG